MQATPKASTETSFQLSRPNKLWWKSLAAERPMVVEKSGSICLFPSLSHAPLLPQHVLSHHQNPQAICWIVFRVIPPHNYSPTQQSSFSTQLLWATGTEEECSTERKSNLKERITSLLNLSWWMLSPLWTRLFKKLPLKIIWRWGKEKEKNLGVQWHCLGEGAGTDNAVLTVLWASLS